MLRSKGNWLLGSFIIILGVILLLNNVGLTKIDLNVLFSTYWPVVFIFFGLHFLSNRGSTGEIVSGFIFIFIGALLLAKNAGLVNIHLDILWDLFWPIIIIFVGLNLLFGHKSSGKANYAIMGAIERKTDPWILQNSTFIAFMGGIDLDLTLAEIPDGVTTIDLTAFMGGIDIIVPQDITIECTGTTILGGIELLNKSTGGIFASTSSSQNGLLNSKKIIKFYCRAIMGGIDIKNKKRT